jgi:hypothetical protein
MLSEMWWVEPIAREVASLLRLCLEQRHEDQLALFFNLLAPLRATIVWVDRIARMAEDMLARAALSTPSAAWPSHFHCYQLPLGHPTET